MALSRAPMLRPEGLWGGGGADRLHLKMMPMTVVSPVKSRWVWKLVWTWSIWTSGEWGAARGMFCGSRHFIVPSFSLLKIIMW